ncbi:MAG: esterase-like activity of phytase family protein [Acidobacteria bacterium]|nr:esterase-like activity of phytase family protein [Acidobacteriota bacterium]
MTYLNFSLNLLLGLFSFSLAQGELPNHETSITVASSPIAAFETDSPAIRHFGRLEFRGGLILTSDYKSFGGFSALLMDPDGEHFLALSDRAMWLRARIVYKDGRPAGITDAVAAPVLDEKGMPAPKLDTESLTRDSNKLYVGLERTQSVLCFDYDDKGFPGRSRPVSVPPELKDLPFNQSLEAIVFVPEKHRLGGTLIAFTEHALTEEGNLKAFLIGGPEPGAFAVKRTDGFDISDAAMLPNGDVLIIERQYSLERGVAMRIRCIQLSTIKPGALVDGPVLVEADARHQIDNMEAMSVHRAPSGEIVLTLMSDNNLSSLQRTVLLQFVLHGK